MNKTPTILAVITAIVSVLAIVVAGIPYQALATKGAQFDAGSAHAVDDCNAGFHKYLNTPGNGPQFHTRDFMEGYWATWEECHSDVQP